MCRLCNRNANYERLIATMLEQDRKRIESTKVLAERIEKLKSAIYSEGEISIGKPMLEPKMPLPVPTNYFQNLLIDGEKAPNAFSHGSTRAIFFKEKKVHLLSKQAVVKDGVEFMAHYIYCSFPFSELSMKIGEKESVIEFRGKKKMTNLITGKEEEKELAFMFSHQNIEGKFTSKDRLVASQSYRSVIARHTNIDSFLDYIGMEGYIVTVAHFAPFPYLLNLHKEYGYDSRKEMASDVNNYLKEAVSE
ncbi:MAG: hypothetical protein QW035_04095 [Candidatus Anstonellales archaeon]